MNLFIGPNRISYAPTQRAFAACPSSHVRQFASHIKNRMTVISHLYWRPPFIYIYFIWKSLKIAPRLACNRIRLRAPMQLLCVTVRNSRVCFTRSLVWKLWLDFFMDGNWKWVMCWCDGLVLGVIVCGWVCVNRCFSSCSDRYRWKFWMDVMLELFIVKGMC